MNVARDAVLWAADNRWLREHLPRYRFVRRSVRRFMPGETLDDALAAATRLRERGLPTMFTALGENVTVPADARRVVDEYREAYDRVADAGLDTEFSVKPTHLGLDLDPQAALANLEELASKAAERENWLWLDMESAAYVEGTLELYRKLRAGHPNVGVCLQAYLKRTADDLDSLMPLDPTIRLVKGAYREPSAVALPAKRDVDANYLSLGRMMLDDHARGGRSRVVFGTHDTQLITDLIGHARSTRVPQGSYEFHMLYGIQREEQMRLAAGREHVRVLIAYGSYWFPWYMRRLAERPANVWFVMKSVLR
jgi:proline dehydrogenase